jgi:protein CpxP
VHGKAPDVMNAAADFFDSLRPDQQAKVREFLASRGHRGHRG